MHIAYVPSTHMHIYACLIYTSMYVYKPCIYMHMHAIAHKHICISMHTYTYVYNTVYIYILMYIP